ncbi:single-stranded-DNA-specific exonuclease RecJ [Candidatus Caldipriscus sp.]|nr:single-stranded-DNA-specific exonuclease RecJ [Candidatus Caldipriscus sp.]
MLSFVLPKDEEVDAPLGRIFRKVLANRGISFKDLETRELYDPFLMENINDAVDRILFALKTNERVLIHGDYDADGITALALLYRVLNDLGFDVIPYIPDRFSEGYGLSREAIRIAKDMGVNLIITVDCGISSKKEVEEAKNYGIDVIITDHHLKPKELPDTLIIHPQGYLNENLTGVGVSFKLAHALLQRLNVRDWKKKLYVLLDLVAVGTVADMGLLIGENRTMVKHGIKILSSASAKAGFKAILKSASINPPIKPWVISFIIAPRLNSAGRMETAMKSFELLTKIKGEDALKFAEEVERLNRERQRIQNRDLKRILDFVETGEPINFVYLEGLHEGVLGILASKLVDMFEKPAFVININGEISRGSARGIEPFNVFEALDRVGYLFENYGGHALAGGFTIKTSKLEVLREKLKEYALEKAPQGFGRTINIDAEISTQDLFDEEFWRDKELLEPYGYGFPEPVFVLKNDGKMEISTDGKTILIFGEYNLCELKVKGDVRGKKDLVITNLRRLADGSVYGEVLGEI